jgi:hypothetical protein
LFVIRQKLSGSAVINYASEPVSAGLRTAQNLTPRAVSGTPLNFASPSSHIGCTGVNRTALKFYVVVSATQGTIPFTENGFKLQTGYSTVYNVGCHIKKLLEFTLRECCLLSLRGQLV